MDSVIVESSFDLAAFWLDALPVFVGAILAFAFGWVAVGFNNAQPTKGLQNKKKPRA